MNWFWFALIALICWSGSDLFSKIGCCGEKDKTAHLKMVVAVGIVMGLHAAYMIVFHHVSVTWDVVWTYLPVSLLYILSMTLGYVGLRYIELSISSPICNSSGALVAVLCLCTGALSDYNGPQKAVILCAVGLGVPRRRRPRRRGGARGRPICAAAVRSMQTASMPRAGLPSACPWPTACSTPPGRLPTASCSNA